MIINNFLNYLFTTPSVISVLRILNQRTEGSTGREIARLSNITHRTAIKALDNLETFNLVKKRIVGKSYYYTINRNQYIYKEIISLILKKEREFQKKVFDSLKLVRCENLVSVIIFGSVARKEENIESDLDVCFIYFKTKKDIEERVNILRDNLYEKYGVQLAPFYITEMDFKSKAKKKKPPVNNIVKDGIVIRGKTLNRLING